ANAFPKDDGRWPNQGSRCPPRPRAESASRASSTTRSSMGATASRTGRRTRADVQHPPRHLLARAAAVRARRPDLPDGPVDGRRGHDVEGGLDPRIAMAVPAGCSPDMHVMDSKGADHRGYTWKNADIHEYLDVSDYHALTASPDGLHLGRF